MMVSLLVKPEVRQSKRYLARPDVDIDRNLGKELHPLVFDYNLIL